MNHFLNMTILLNNNDAQVSINKGNTRILTYTAQRLKKMGIKREYWEKVLSPMGAHFSFETIETPISITPLAKIPIRKVQVVVEQLVARGILRANCCYFNAMAIAECLQKAGINVRCVDGYCFNSMSGCWHKHRFNEIGGLYFDATAEYFIRAPYDIHYRGVRLFTGDELVGISAAFNTLANGNSNYKYYCYYCSTLPYNAFYESGDGSYFDYCIDNNGYLCKNGEDIAA